MQKVKAALAANKDKIVAAVVGFVQSVNPKVKVPAIAGAVASVALAVIQGPVDPTTLSVAITTVVYAVVGYRVPASAPAKPSA